ncbi:single-stranded-DNA-specific exonuclease RecJ [Vibrio ponticus]|nr:single-stranded-DNA-specific exonuclease RecJ [Vibrio ponticus]
MSFGVELLLSNNIHAARRMASELDGLNQTRKEIEEGMKQEAMAFCERLQFGENANCRLDWYCSNAIGTKV